MKIAEIIERLEKIADKTIIPDGMRDSNKKILIAASHSLQLGGAPLALLTILEALSDEYECLVVAPSQGDITDKFVAAKMAVFTGPATKFDCNEFREAIESADLYFCNTVVSGFYVSLAYDLSTPTIWWIHEEHDFINYYLKDLYVKKCTSPNILAVAVSKKAQSAVREILHLPCELLHLGIEDCLKSYECHKKGDNKVSFFMPANLLYAKGHDVIAKAITMLPEEYLQKSEFVFAGGYDSVEDYAYKLMQILTEKYNNVKFLGKLDRSEVYEKLAEADCLMAPSRIDTLPTTVVEGMMMKKICLVSNAAGISRYMTNLKDGVIFESEKPEKLVEAIEYIIDNIEKMDDIRSAGRAVYLEQFSLSEAKNAVFSLIEKIENNKLKNADKRVVMFTGIIDILDIFTYRLGYYFSEQGYDVFWFDAKKSVQSMVELIPFMMKKVKAVVTFNNAGVELEISPGKNFWEMWNTPVVNIMMDHPFCFPANMAKMLPNAIVLCIDRNHMNYLLKFYPEISMAGYLPHGGIELPGPKKPLEERNIDVLYVGGLSRNSAHLVMPDFSKYTAFDAKELCREAYEYLIENVDKTLEDTIEMLLEKRGIVYEYEVLREIIADLHVVDLYVVSHYRELAVKVVAEAGIDIHLYGVGWDGCEWLELPNVHFGGRISADEAVEKMKDSKIVLNTMTWFKDGTHDRVFNGMLQKAVTVSDESIYMHEEFNGIFGNDRESNKNCDMVLFNLKQVNKLPDIIKTILNDNELAEKIAENGYRKAVEKHTWEARGQELINDLFSEI